MPASSSEPPRFLAADPFAASKRHAARHGCDLAVPSSIGIGSLVCYTPLVEAFARRAGRPLRLLTAPLVYSDLGRHPEECDYPIWQNNPFLSEVVNADSIDPAIMLEVSAEFDNFCQFGHVIENICAPYGLRPRRLAGSLFLTSAEMQWGLQTLSPLRRPAVCLCPYGRSSSLPDSPWYTASWLRLIQALSHRVGFFQTGHNDFRQKPLPVLSPPAGVRQAMALIWASDIYIGFDTGLTHIAAAFGTPSVALWDALRKTPLEDAKQAGFGVSHMSRWAYPQNRNLTILHERHAEVLEECIRFVAQTADGWERYHPLAHRLATVAPGA